MSQTNSIEKSAILGATGPTGIHLAAALLRRGIKVRVVSRSRASLERLFPDPSVERIPADALRPGEVLRAIEGCTHVFDCIGLPADQMDKHPVTARNVAAAFRETGARCLQVSSFWAYLPLQAEALNEKHPRTGGNDWVRLRREAEDILQGGGAAVVHLPDFYGPHIHTSTLQKPLEDAAKGGAMNWIGPPDLAREYIYVPDAMAIAADLAGRPEAYGERWVLPGAGPLTGRHAAEVAGNFLGREVKLRTAGLFLMKLLGLVNKEMRAFLPMAPDYLKPVRYDGSKIRRLLGTVPARPYEEAIPETLEWIRTAGGG